MTILKIAIDSTCPILLEDMLEGFLRYVPNSNNGYIVGIFDTSLLEEYAVTRKFDILGRPLRCGSGNLIKPIVNWANGETVYVITDGYFPDKNEVSPNLKFWKYSLSEDAKNLLTDNLF